MDKQPLQEPWNSHSSLNLYKLLKSIYPRYQSSWWYLTRRISEVPGKHTLGDAFMASSIKRERLKSLVRAELPLKPFTQPRYLASSRSPASVRFTNSRYEISRSLTLGKSQIVLPTPLRWRLRQTTLSRSQLHACESATPCPRHHRHGELSNTCWRRFYCRLDWTMKKFEITWCRIIWATTLGGINHEFCRTPSYGQTGASHALLQNGQINCNTFVFNLRGRDI